MNLEAKLLEDFKALIKMEKVTYDLPSDSKEQVAAFISIENTYTKISDAREVSRVRGRISVFAPREKMQAGFFQRQMAKASPELSKRFHFFDAEETGKTYLDIVERSQAFFYFYDSQYNPAIGILNEINLTIVES